MEKWPKANNKGTSEVPWRHSAGPFQHAFLSHSSIIFPFFCFCFCFAWRLLCLLLLNTLEVFLLVNTL